MFNVIVKRDVSAKVVFRQAEKHMLQQAQKSTSEECSEFSMYHGANGRTCPVGIFIPAQNYYEALEGVPVSDKAVLDALDIVATPGVVKVLRALQDLHDDVLPEVWRGRLRSLARKFKFDGAGDRPLKKKGGR